MKLTGGEMDEIQVMAKIKEAMEKGLPEIECDGVKIKLPTQIKSWELPWD